MAGKRTRLNSRYVRNGYSPLLVTLVAGTAAAALDYFTRIPAPAIGACVAISCVGIAAWGLFNSRRRAERIRKTLSDDANYTVGPRRHAIT